MNPLSYLNDRLVRSRKESEIWYALALQEFQTGEVRPGLMAKAMAECGGDERRARAVYIKLLATALRDDEYIVRRASDQSERESCRVEAAKIAAERQDAERRKAEEEQQRRKAAKPTNQISNIMLVGFVIAIAVLWSTWYFGDDKAKPRKPSEEKQSQPVDQADADYGQTAVLAQEQARVDYLIRRYELTNPELDPKSASYSQAAVDAVELRRKYYGTYKTKSASEALEFAYYDYTHDVLGVKPPKNNQAIRAADPGKSPKQAKQRSLTDCLSLRDNAEIARCASQASAQ